MNNGHNDVLLKALNKRGVIVELHVSRWRGTVRACPEDLGLEISEEARKRLALGRLRLLDEKDLQGIAQTESRARHELCRYSRLFPLGGHFVSLKAIPTLDRELKQIEARFWEEVDKLLEEYDGRRQEMIDQWQVYAKEVFENQEAAESFIERIEAAYPSHASLRGKFRLDWTMHQVALPKQLDFELLEAEEADRMLQLQEEKKQAARREIAEFAGQQAVAVRQMLAEVSKHVLEAVRQKDKVTNRQLEMLRRKLDLIPLLQLSEDPSLDRRIGDLQNMLGDGSGDKAKELNQSEANKTELTSTLHAIGSELTADAESIQQSAREYLTTYARAFD